MTSYQALRDLAAEIEAGANPIGLVEALARTLSELEEYCVECREAALVESDRAMRLHEEISRLNEGLPEAERSRIRKEFFALVDKAGEEGSVTADDVLDCFERACPEYGVRAVEPARGLSWGSVSTRAELFSDRVLRPDGSER